MLATDAESVLQQMSQLCFPWIPMQIHLRPLKGRTKAQVSSYAWEVYSF